MQALRLCDDRGGGRLRADASNTVAQGRCLGGEQQWVGYRGSAREHWAGAFESPPQARRGLGGCCAPHAEGLGGCCAPHAKCPCRSRHADGEGTRPAALLLRTPPLLLRRARRCASAARHARRRPPAPPQPSAPARPPSPRSAGALRKGGRRSSARPRRPCGPASPATLPPTARSHTRARASAACCPPRADGGGRTTWPPTAARPHRHGDERRVRLQPWWSGE